MKIEFLKERAKEFFEIIKQEINEEF